MADAVRLDHRIYATLRGTGVASDGRHSSLMSPRVDGQVLALERAYRLAGVDPARMIALRPRLARGLPRRRIRHHAISSGGLGPI